MLKAPGPDGVPPDLRDALEKFSKGGNVEDGIEWLRLLVGYQARDVVTLSRVINELLERVYTVEQYLADGNSPRPSKPN